MRRTSEASLLAAILGAFACKARGPAPVCAIQVSDAREREEADEIRGESLLQELIEGFDLGTGRPPAELRDCRGRRVEAPRSGCDGAAEMTERRPTRPLDKGDLVISGRDGNEFLFWAQGEHYVDGSALGPAGYARWNQRGFLVFEVGALHGPASHARLRREPLDGHHVLVVEGDACPGEEASCVRVVGLVPIVDGQFVDAPMRLRGGGCGGRATFPLIQEHEVTLPDGRRRRFRLQRSVAVKGGDALVFEEAVATDFDPKQPGSPGVEHRRASKERRLRLDQQGLIIDPGIWEDLLEIAGSVRPSERG